MIAKLFELGNFGMVDAGFPVVATGRVLAPGLLFEHELEQAILEMLVRVALKNVARLVARSCGPREVEVGPSTFQTRLEVQKDQN